MVQGFTSLVDLTPPDDLALIQYGFGLISSRTSILMVLLYVYHISRIKTPDFLPEE